MSVKSFFVVNLLLEKASRARTRLQCLNDSHFQSRDWLGGVDWRISLPFKTFLAGYSLRFRSWIQCDCKSKQHSRIPFECSDQIPHAGAGGSSATPKPAPKINGVGWREGKVSHAGGRLSRFPTR